MPACKEGGRKKASSKALQTVPGKKVLKRPGAQKWDKRHQTKPPASQNPASWSWGFFLTPFCPSQVLVLPKEYSFPPLLQLVPVFFNWSSKTHQKHNLITSPKKKGGVECKHDSFLSPDTSGQADNVLKQNKSALTVTSKSSARGLQLLKAQECCC